MLRLRFWKPAPGVRSFLIELLIVVLGVLIALGAQQAVDGWNQRREVADFRAAVDGEIGRSLAIYQLRVAQSPCLRQRIAELDRWQRDWSDGNGPAATGELGRPLGVMSNSAVWRAGSASAASQMPLKERLAYAEFYDSLELYPTLLAREIANWYELFAYEGAIRLSPEETNRLRGLILAAQWTDRSLVSNFPTLVNKAASLGVKPESLPAGLAADRIAQTRLCTPFVTGASR